jgi:mRNA interferase YafQ
MKIKRSALFKKQYKACRKRGLDMDLLDAAITAVFEGNVEALAKMNDHGLKGKYKNDRELHVKDDWLMTYGITDGRLILLLLAIGTHRDVLNIE